MEKKVGEIIWKAAYLGVYRDMGFRKFWQPCAPIAILKNACWI